MNVKRKIKSAVESYLLDLQVQLLIKKKQLANTYGETNRAFLELSVAWTELKHSFALAFWKDLLK